MAKKYQSDVIIIGGGLAGIVAALELLDHNKQVVLLERDEKENFGGLARWSFGGVFMVNTPQQKWGGIKDSPELALADWHSFAQFAAKDHWPRKWAEEYIHRSLPDIYYWLKKYSVSFFPVVHWVERGYDVPGNSLPRFHMVWGTGKWLVDALVLALENHPCRDNLQLCFGHNVENLWKTQGQVSGCYGKLENSQETFEAQGEQVIIASGGIGGDINKVRENWPKKWGNPPKVILNGAHPYSDGKMHACTTEVGGHISHLDKMWNYAAGIHHPQPHMPEHGLSLVPLKSALWMDYQGKRIGPTPLVSGYDTSFLVKEICKQPRKYSWQIFNRKIALKELAVSGAESNEAIRDKKLFSFLKSILLGNSKLVNKLCHECPDFVMAESVAQLAQKMNQLNQDDAVDKELLAKEIKKYDAQIDRGVRFHNDDQLRRIAHLRQYRGDRVRTCKFQKIVDPKALPLIAVRCFILSRKSLGGIQTNLASQVLAPNGESIAGLYAVGEAAGFGGGGIHGQRALEGTFLGSCILTGQAAARAIIQQS